MEDAKFLIPWRNEVRNGKEERCDFDKSVRKKRQENEKISCKMQLII
jgi:hypothetical protein